MMTSAFLGWWALALADDDPGGTEFGSVDADAVPEEADAGLGADEARVSPLPDARVVIVVSEGEDVVITGPGLPGAVVAPPEAVVALPGAVVAQAETTAIITPMAQRIRGTDRCPGRCDGIDQFTTIFNRPSAAALGHGHRGS
jgi:hypothetical protein